MALDGDRAALCSIVESSKGILLDLPDFEEHLARIAASLPDKELQVRAFQAQRTRLSTELCSSAALESAHPLLWHDPYDLDRTAFVFHGVAKRGCTTLQWYFDFDATHGTWGKLSFEGPPLLFLGALQLGWLDLTKATIDVSTVPLYLQHPHPSHIYPVCHCRRDRHPFVERKSSIDTSAAARLAAKAPVLHLPQELRDAIFWNLTKDTAYVTVHYIKPEKLEAFLSTHRDPARCLLEDISPRLEDSRSSLPSGPLLVTSDGSTSLRMSRINRQLQREYEAARAHFRTSQPPTSVAIVSGELTKEEQIWLKSIKIFDDNKPLFIILWFDQPPKIHTLRLSIISILAALPTEFRGKLHLIVLFSTFHSLAQSCHPRVQNDPFPQPTYGKSGFDVEVTEYAIQRLSVYPEAQLSLTAKDNDARTWTNLCRLIELPYKEPFVAVACVRHEFSQIICAILRRHPSGEQAVHDCMDEMEPNNNISPTELMLLDGHTIPRGAVQQTISSPRNRLGWSKGLRRDSSRRTSARVQG